MVLHLRMGADVAAIERECECRGWELVGLLPAPSSRAVARVADCRGGTLVVKLAPEGQGHDRELVALRAWQNSGLTARVMLADGDLLVLEDLGGRSLQDVGRLDAGRLRELGSTLAVLHATPPPDGPPTALEHARTRTDRMLLNERIPTGVRELGARAFAQLERGRGRGVLLHGDFHWGNVLAGAGGLRVIDPYGFLGDAAYDLTMFAACLPSNQRETLVSLAAGYGCPLPRLSLWWQWMVCHRLDNAWCYLPDAIAERTRLALDVLADAR